MVLALQAAVGPCRSQIAAAFLFAQISEFVTNFQREPEIRRLICAPPPAHLRFFVIMSESVLRCDGCGQPASSEHIAKRLQRLEWTTRYRPVHIGTLMLGAVAPENDADFVYSPAGAWKGEAEVLLSAAGLITDGKSAEATLAEFQRAGLFLTHVLECPLEDGVAGKIQELIGNRLPAMLARIRRSLKPKRLAPISMLLEQVLPALNSGGLPCAILLDQGKPFAMDGEAAGESARHLREALASQSASTRQGSA
jgi:hypothetical protein